MTKKRFMAITLIIAIIMGMATFGIYGNTAVGDDQNGQIKNYIKDYVSQFVQQGYSGYYDIKGVDVKIDEFKIDENGNVEALVYASMKNVLKAKKTSDLPFFRGMLKKANIADTDLASFDTIEKSIIEKNSSKLEKQQANRAAKSIARMNEDLKGYIGKEDVTNFIFKYTASTVGDIIDRNTEKLYAENFDQYIPAGELLPKTEAQLEQDGANQILSDMSNADLDRLSAPGQKKAIQTIYASYDRLAARDYANTYTSNATVYCSHNSVKQDPGKWNTSVYPSFLYNFCHNDCADYVSQCLNKGGMPKDSTWTRGSADYSWTYAWQNCVGLRSYMKNTKAYWVTSTYSAASAGGVILYKDSSGNPYHVTMIVKNDTVTRLYSGHTTDRLQIAYSSSTSCEYYICW